MNYHYYRDNPQEARHNELNAQLDRLRKDFAGIGTKKAKIKLNKLTSTKAKILRLMMEIEDVNIRAKRYRGDWKDNLYQKKNDLIWNLIDLYLTNDLVYGVHDSDVNTTTHIIYFELEHHQISWHFSYYSDKPLPLYNKEWDGIKNTYKKLESIYNQLFNNNLFSNL